MYEDQFKGFVYQSSFVEDENENENMTWHALGHWDENIVFGAKIES